VSSARSGLSTVKNTGCGPGGNAFSGAGQSGAYKEGLPGSPRLVRSGAIGWSSDSASLESAHEARASCPSLASVRGMVSAPPLPRFCHV
jgi:hypothetical protein